MLRDTVGTNGRDSCPYIFMISKVVENIKSAIKVRMLTVNRIAPLIEATVIGNGNIRIRGMASPQIAKKNDVTFAFNAEELEGARESSALCVLTTEKVENYPKTILHVTDIKKALVILYNGMLEFMPPQRGTIHPTALIAPDVKIGCNVGVGPYAVIGEGSELGENSIIDANSVIGKNVMVGKASHIYPNVTIYDYTRIGNKVMIHSGTVIGADGFGYVPKDGKIYKVPQLGIVIIEDEVEIGANTCIDRGTFENTVIGKGTKIDNLVQVAHNVKVGKNVFLAGQAGIAGSATIGDNTMLGGQVGVSDHVNVGKNVKAGAKSGIYGSVGDDKTIFGYPYREADEARKLHGLLSILVKHEKKLRKFLRTLPEDIK